MSKEPGTNKATSSHGGGSDAVVTSPMTDVRATSLFHALSEIEQFSAAEMRVSLPDGVVPMLPKLSFMDVGFKNGVVTTAITFLLAPITMLAVDHFIPVFGSDNPSWLDKAFVYAFASAPAWALALLIAFVSAKTYRGQVTKSLINGLLFSYAISKITLSIFLIAVAYFIYSRVFTAELVYKIVDSGRDVIEFIQNHLIKTASIEGTYYFLLGFRETIIKAANFAALLHVGTATVLLISHIIGIQRTKKIELLRREWE
jgi:hypothetical protein